MHKMHNANNTYQKPEKMKKREIDYLWGNEKKLGPLASEHNTWATIMDFFGKHVNLNHVTF
jgi:hypothetical protein